MYQHAVIATKAYPLHYGHIHVINKAREQSTRVTVFVVYGPGESPSGVDRAAAVQRTFPDVNVKLVADIGTDDTDPASSVYWGRYAWDIMEDNDFDAVFGSEPYLYTWAEAMGVEAVMVDTRRTLVPVSGTEIRNDPMANWSYIAEEFRPFYLKRVLVVGAESTGKTTLCKKLAQTYSTRFVPEYGRVFVEEYVPEGMDIETIDKRIIFGSILNNQERIAKEIELQSHRICFYDTDFFTTMLWYEQWQNSEDSLYRLLGEAVDREANKWDLVLISTDQHATWDYDGWREQTSGVRAEFTRRLQLYFDERAENGGCPYVTLGGTWATREYWANSMIKKIVLP